MTKLTRKREKFCREYLVDFNGTRAAIRAGYRKRTARSMAAQLLTKLNVKARLSELGQKVIKENDLSVARFAEEVRRLAFYDPRAFFDHTGKPIDIQNLDEETAAALAGFETQSTRTRVDGGDEDVITTTRKIKLADKLRALEIMGKYLGVFGPDAPNLNVSVVVNTQPRLVPLDTDIVEKAALQIEAAKLTEEAPTECLKPR